MVAIARRTLLASLLAPLAAPTGRAVAQTWPGTQVVKLTVPFAPGGSVDAIGRLMAVGLQRQLGTNVIVENRAGGGGAIGATVVAKAPPDGLNWLVVFDSHAVLPSLMTLSFDARKDLDPVLLIGTSPMVLACHPSKPYKTIADVIAAAKAKPDAVNFGTIGNGSLGHLTMVRLGKKLGFTASHVPYRGGGPLVNDALGGQIDLAIGSTALLIQQIQAGALRPLLQTGAKRQPVLPDTPTVAEIGAADLEALSWWGVFAPGGTPRPLVERMAAEIRTALSEPNVAKQLVETQQVNLLLQGPDDLRRFFDEQMTVWGAVVRENAIKPD